MGVCHVDTRKNERKLDDTYSLSSVDGIKKLLEDIPYLGERRYFEGDFDACNILVDLAHAIEIAIVCDRLTEKQRQAMKLIYIEGYTCEEAGEKMGISDTTVYQHAEKACEKLALMFADWKYNEVI
jgi:RNA polymerase sigma factor (sigma-70 family)